MENLKGRFVINYKIERGKLYMQYTGQGWWNRSYRINTTMMNSTAAQGRPHIIIWYNAALIMMHGMVLISVTATGCRGCQKFYMASISLVSSWLSKWVWKRAFPCSARAVVAVSAALKVTQHVVLWGNAHVEETRTALLERDTCVCRDACIQWNAR